MQVQCGWPSLFAVVSLRRLRQLISFQVGRYVGERISALDRDALGRLVYIFAKAVGFQSYMSTASKNLQSSDIAGRRKKSWAIQYCEAGRLQSCMLLRQVTTGGPGGLLEATIP